MRRLIWPVLFLFLMLLQGSMSVYYTGWLSCDLLLLAVYAYALLRGEKAGAVVGGITGLLQDAMTVGIFGFHILSRICVGYIVGLTKEKVFKDNYLLSYERYCDDYFYPAFCLLVAGTFAQWRTLEHIFCIFMGFSGLYYRQCAVGMACCSYNEDDL